VGYHVPRKVPSSKHLSFIPYGLPKVELSCIKTEKVSDREGFFSVTGCPKRCSYQGMPKNVPKEKGKK
jgi:hypothetical protein